LPAKAQRPVIIAAAKMTTRLISSRLATGHRRK